jgi:hypothetical protein
MQQHWPAGRKARPRLLRHPCRDPAFLRRDVPYTNGPRGSRQLGKTPIWPFPPRALPIFVSLNQRPRLPAFENLLAPGST